MRCFVPIVLAISLTALILAGCDSRSQRVPVAGQVLIDGKPLETGFIWIEPDSDRAAVGQIDASGRFRMTTYDDHDGCVLGTHRVAVASTKALGTERTLHLIPPKYRESSKSELTVTIDGPTEDLKIELTWAGGAPYVEDVGGGGDVGPAAVSGGTGGAESDSPRGESAQPMP
jgi:hypothetical protein